MTYAPANKRDVGLVFQNYALFPHMSVAKNVGFGLAVRKIRGAAAAERISEALAQVHLTAQAGARVDELSGGQQQRVALARALVYRPQLLLLDEPMSNLDARLRLDTRAALRNLHAETGITSIYVTHDQAEALAMSTRVTVMNTAELHQVGTPAEVYERPSTRFVATFLGQNNIFDSSISSSVIHRRSFRISTVCCPSIGDGMRILPGVPLSFIGIPGIFSLPATGCSTSTIISRASTCSLTTTLSMELIGPFGTPA